MLRYFVEATFYGVIACLALAIASAMSIVHFNAGLWLPIVFVAAVLPATLAGILRKDSGLRILIDTDRRLGLKERVSTAYQLMHGGDTGGVNRLAIADAAEHAMSIDPKKVFSAKLPKKAWAIPLLAAIAVVLLFIDLDLPAVLRHPATPLAAEQGLQIEELGKRLAARAKRETLPETFKLSEEMQRVGQELQQEKLSQEDSLQRVLDLASQAQKIASELAQRLKTRTGQATKKESEDIEPKQLSPRGQGQPQPNRSDEYFGKIRDESGQPLPSMGPTETPSPLSADPRSEKSPEGGASSPSANGPEDNEADVEDSNFAEEQDSDRAAQIDRQRQVQQERGDLESMAEAEGRLREMADALGGENGGTDPGEQSGSQQDLANRKQEGPEATENGQAEGTGRETAGNSVSDAIGDTPAKDEPGPPDVPDRSAKRAITELKGRISSEETVRILIRSLPEAAETSANFEDLMQSYQKQMEETILKETMPPNQREYVRDYFLLLGVAEE